MESVQTETGARANENPVATEEPSWDVLPCEGIFKLTSARENVTFSYCHSEYWKCPNKSCIMQLV